jgi:SAM-dependent methyltransferase
MTNYARMYRLGMTPWEKYGRAAAASISAVLDREEKDRHRPLGRALDLGCGRGQFTPELARRGWQAVGVDYVPAAIEAARSQGTKGVTYVVADITSVAETDLGRFGFFLDIGCFQGLDAGQRRAAGATVSALAEPGATILMLAFGPSRYRALVGGVSRSDVSAAFPGWQILAAEPADTAGLGWPMNRTAPQWYRLRR